MGVCSLNRHVCGSVPHLSPEWDCAEARVGLFRPERQVQSDLAHIWLWNQWSHPLEIPISKSFLKNIAFIFSGRFVLNAEAIINA